MAMEKKNYSLISLAEAVRCGEVSAVEVCREHLEMSEHSETRAFITLMGDTALAVAESVDKRVAAGETLPLAGVPFAVKDNICTAGMRTTCASRMLADFVPSYSATAYDRLLAAGAVPIGKANMDEFAVGDMGDTSYFGGCRNPIDMTRVPGGSSAGSAAALAEGLVLGALGSDTGGSSRQPASYCGVFALKPTYGAVSRFGLVGMAPSLEQICPMAADLDGCERIFNVIKGRDLRDMTSRDLADGDCTCERVGVYLPGDAPNEVKAVISLAAERLAEQGIGCENMTLPETDTVSRVYYTISSAEAYSTLSRFDGIRYGRRADDGKSHTARSEGFGKRLRERLAEGVYSLEHDGGAPYVNALELREGIKRGVDALFGEYDLILTPVVDTTAPKIGEGAFGGDRYNFYANLTGCPALAIPCGKGEDGLPMGIQLMAPRGGESRLFAAARKISGEVAR